MNQKSSIRILAIAAISAVLSLAFVFSASGTFVPQQSSKGSYGINGEQNIATTSTLSHNDDINQNTHSIPPSFASNEKSVDETKVAELRIALRHLWADHVVWTRLYIISAVAGTPDVDVAAQRLLKNQEDIGDAIKPFYGNDAGDKLTSLLKDHILIAVDLLNAAKAGDNAGVEEAEKRWYDNADDIAAFLSEANPDNWPREGAVEMLNEHLSLTKSEAVARLTGDYQTDVETFDEIFEQSMVMADHLAQGLVKQFPKQFK